jgi:orotate phosphoribosyltransferase
VAVTVPDVLGSLPVRNGHFLLESGYHTDVWLSLDSLFVNPSKIAPMLTSLAERLGSHEFSAVCGCLMGGAFLAHALSMILGTAFYYTEPITTSDGTALFATQYRLPADLRGGLRGLKVVVVDDVISAGSSARATIATLEAAGASTTAVGTLMTLGNVGRTHFARLGLPLESLVHKDLLLWTPTDCPLCRSGVALEDPRVQTGE